MPRLPGFPTDCTIRFDGEPVPARAGEPVASALLAAGKVLVSRSAKYHRPRGAFCLAGACGTCLVRADGLPSQRACRTACRDGLAIETQNAVPDARHDLLGLIDPLTPRGLDHHHLATWSAVANRAAVAVARRLAGLGRLPDAAALAAARALPPAGPETEERWDALVVGAGPAGLAAAEALAEAGRRVLLAEREPRIGGRLRCRLEPEGAPDLAWAGRAAERVRAVGGEVATGTTVLGLWHDGGAPLAALEADGPPATVRLVRAARLVVCAGAAPLPLAIPGGDRPGVFGARGLAVALAEHGVVPGEHVVVEPDGGDARAFAAVFQRAGVKVDVGAEFGVEGVVGRGRVRGIRTARGTIACDTIAVTSLAPSTDLARALGAEVGWDEALGAFALRADLAGRTAVPGLLAAGEATGRFGSAELAADAGRRAGEAARG